MVPFTAGLIGAVAAVSLLPHAVIDFLCTLAVLVGAVHVIWHSATLTLAREALPPRSHAISHSSVTRACQLPSLGKE